MNEDQNMKDSSVSGTELDDDAMDAVAGGMDYLPDDDRDDYWRPGETFALTAFCNRCGCEITNWRATTEIYGKVAVCNHGSSMESSHYRRFIKSDGVTIEPFNGRLLGG
jgi:hypothetical protein